jgi:hypothetical protein
VLFPAGNPVGQLQLGGCAGTLNGLVMLCALSTPYAADGSGFIQGGRPGFTGAVQANIQTIVAYLGSLGTSKRLGSAAYFGGPDNELPIEHMPRGGL